MPEFLTNNTDPVVEHDSLGVPSAPDDNGRWWSSVEITPNDLKGALQKLWDNSLAALSYIKSLTGPSGTIGNITDVDDSAKSNGFVLSYSTDVTPPKWLAVPLETGVLVLRAGDDKLDELLSENQRTLEAGTTGWQADTNCTIIQSATQARTGSNSLRLESSAAGNLRAITLPGASGWDATAQSVYYAEGYSRAQSTGRDSGLGFAFYDGSGTIIGTIAAGTVSANSNSGWTQHTVQATAPAGTVTGALVAIVEGAAANLDLRGAVIDSPSTDAITFYPGGGRIKQVSSGYTIQQNDDGAKIEVDTTSAAVTVTLPSGYRDGFEVNIIKIAGSNDVSIVADGTLEGVTGIIANTNNGLRVYVTGATTWRALPFSGGGIGSIVQAATAPADGTYVLCDGSLYLQSVYPLLFEKIGILYDETPVNKATTGGAISGGDLSASTSADKAFDGTNSAWGSSQTDTAVIDAAWIGNDLGSTHVVTQVTLENGASSPDRTPSAIDIQTASDVAFTSDVQTYSVPSGDIDGTAGAIMTFTVGNLIGRYVRAIARGGIIFGNAQWTVNEMTIIAGGASYNTATEFAVPDIQNASKPVYIKAAN